MVKFEYIKAQSELDSLVKQYQQSDILVLDTEFVRTRTYYAKLGLIQAYDGKVLALIDPTDIDDLSTFWALLTNNNILKLVHSCSEDLEIFQHYGQCQPAPLLDSQIAASLCDLGHGLGYAKLVDSCLNVSLDKGESRTDWLKRPLTQAQLQYAANDVYYLYQLYPILKSLLDKKQRFQWVIDEGARLTSAKSKSVSSDDAYLKVKNAFQLTSIELAYLKVLALWRMEKAIVKDMSLGFVVKDHGLIALAKKQPKTLTELTRINELSEQEKRIYGKELIMALKNVDLSYLPEQVDVLALRPGYKAAFKTIKELLSDICQQQQIPIELLASKRLIHDYLYWYWKGKKAMKPILLTGWREKIVSSAIELVKVEIK